MIKDHSIIKPSRTPTATASVRLETLSFSRVGIIENAARYQ
ncbi:hypothetical protein [Nostoc sp.]